MMLTFSAQRLRDAIGRLKPEMLFLALACPFGLAALVVNGPFQAPDESDHFARVFQLSEGTLIGEKRGDTAGGELPRAAIDVTDTGDLPFHYQKKVTRGLLVRLAHPAFIDWNAAPRVYDSFPHSVVYAPAGYLPQVAAVFIGRHLRIGPLGLMYLARLGGFAASVALGFAALRVLPIYRWTTVAVLLCPMSLYLFGSIAPDGILIAGSVLLAALLARRALRGSTPGDFRELAEIVILAGLLATAKPVYLPLAGAAFLLVLPSLGSFGRKAWFSAAFVLCCLLPALLWARVSASLFVPSKGPIPIDPTAQAHHIIAAPMAFLALVAHTIRVQYVAHYQWMVGTLGWGDTPMPAWFYPLFGYGILGCLALESGESARLRWWPRCAMWAAAALSLMLIYAAQYASWNAPGSVEPIEGIEGRYFLPLAPWVILGIPAILRPSRRLAAAVLAGVLATLCAAVCVWALILRYYVPPAPLPSTSGTARLIQVSTRAVVGYKENVLITGLVVGGNGLETLLIRANSSGLIRQGMTGVLRLPSLSVLRSDGTVLASNAGWMTRPEHSRIAAASAAVEADEFPVDGKDSAVIVEIPGGVYTVQVCGTNGTTGVVQEEIFELSGNGTRLTSVSSRGFVGKGDNMMVLGIVVGGKGTEALLCRADGPSLGQFGVVGALSRPTLAISPVQSGNGLNEAWAISPAKNDIAASAERVGTFPLAPDSADSAAVVSLSPGVHTMKVRGVAGVTGIALAEVYELP